MGEQGQGSEPAKARVKRRPSGDHLALVRVDPPLRLARLKSEDVFDLVASDERRALLRMVSGTRPAPGTRLVLVPHGEGRRPLRYVVQALGPENGAGDDPVHVRWMLITAVRKRSYLVDVLRDVLGLKVQADVSRDHLERDKMLVYDAERKRIRAVILRGPTERSDVVPEFSEPEGGDAAASSTSNVSAGAAGDGADPMQWLLFKRETAEGEYETSGDRLPMSCSWVGFQRCRFETDSGGEAFSQGMPIRVGVPTAPLLSGLVWLDGRIKLATVDAGDGSAVVEVEWANEPHMMPSSYRSLVAFCRMETLKRLQTEGGPKFVS